MSVQALAQLKQEASDELSTQFLSSNLLVTGTLAVITGTKDHGYHDDVVRNPFLRAVLQDFLSESRMMYPGSSVFVTRILKPDSELLRLQILATV